MQNINRLRDILKSPKKIIIVPHSKPDADALGSSLGLAAFLQKKQHQVLVISPTEYPDFLTWMKGNNEVLIYRQDPEKAENEIASADVIFTLDFCALDRAGDLEDFIRSLF